METATFGAGCFWSVEETFRTLKGVVSTAVGYMGGTLKNPTYSAVCSDETGHIEVVQVVFDPTVVSYRKLLEIFWNCHDPTTLNRQGPDVGTQYKSVIFYYTEEQKKEALRSLAELQKKVSKKIVTEILRSAVFYPAEEYHQKYLMKKGLKVCR
ncbi:peptide-methionine (S)-S-oxide reductase MsrA [Candidatus Woesearchaeota archaeon]|nr:peptide-methionine (S)-S-oxide reductase MsrA [Candidatus Woesearchaeota archaeon]